MEEKKKIMLMFLAVVMVGSSILAMKNVFPNGYKENIKVMAYKPSAQVKESGYQIDKYEKVESIAWLNDNEVLTLTKKEEFKNTDSTIQVRYCSIYNLNTKNAKEFKAVNIANFIGVSSDKKYILYEEPKYIPEIESKEWQKAYDSGELFHHEIKMLNLATGEITKLDTIYDNSNAEYTWVSDNKILKSYHNNWVITDVYGKKYAEGSYKARELDIAWIAGTDIKDLGNSVEGKVYYSQWQVGGKIGIKVLSMDVKTNEIKSIFYNTNSLRAEKRGKTILVDNYVDNEEISPGVYNRTFGAYVINEKGEILNDIKLTKASIGEFVLSPNGGKVAYVENAQEKGGNSKLKVINIKTGVIKQIMEDSMLSNVCWDVTGTSLSFTSGNSAFVAANFIIDHHDIKGKDVQGIRNKSVNNVNNIDTYIVSFDD